MTTSRGSLRRSLGLIDGAAIVIGITIGSGIFASPGRVVAQVGSVGMAMAVWVVGGLLSLAGALCYAELGAALPVAGGEYAYLSRSLGRPLGFMFTWTQFFVMKTGAQAIVSIVFASYLGSILFGLDPRGAGVDGDWRIKAIAVSALVVLTAINCLGVRQGAVVQLVFTALKLVGLAGIIVLGFVGLTQGGWTHFVQPFAGSIALPSAFGGAMITSLWAYDGWSNLNAVGEELREPERNIPRAIILGTLGVMVVYILANIAYLAVLTPAEMASSRAAATALAVRIIGPVGGVLVPLAVAFSTFGTTNGSLITGARIFYAAARDGQFPRPFSYVSPQAVPTVALVAQGAWAVLLVLPGDFGTLVDYFGFAAWLFYALTVIGLIVLRVQAPDLPRPYRVRPYPLIPILFLLVASFLIVNALSTTPQAWFALGFMGIGLVVYFLFFRTPKLEETITVQE
ncbi:amino acid permease [Gloeobacter kilaueensis]|uniref:Fructoselysine transporter n=1 Tax=Gloeobacter kilaueensis (strain ATCC BAA-2537 / CCAP 1431/1 / ULC 316 / JS1) TaxID=1183438 RepID=U5QR59_GLOK1|nr:amino acid permease [Gloeobacter kilaueensis]AGY60144.1 fructoselysine transporter [Gloeobacter kilaueensis JS1]